MNERIKQLALQAGLVWRVQPPHYTNTSNPIDFPVSANCDLEKFAELVIEDCVDLLRKEWYELNNLPEVENEMHRDIGLRVGAKSELIKMMAVMKQHFGVEE